jgi:exodeoxyribonuclease V gamma subunit
MGLAAEHKDPMGKAQTAFNGAHQKRGEYQDSSALQRVFNSFEDIAPTLGDWATRLYEPMHKAAKVIHLSADHAEEADA